MKGTWVLPLPQHLQQLVDSAPLSSQELDVYFEHTVAKIWGDIATQDIARHAYYDEYRLTHSVRDLPHAVLRDAGFFGAMMRRRREAAAGL